MPNPLVSIVILNYKRLSALEQTLESVVAQTYAHREIIVVDNHSEEEVATAVQRLGPKYNSLNSIAISGLAAEETLA